MKKIGSGSNAITGTQKQPFLDHYTTDKSVTKSQPSLKVSAAIQHIEDAHRLPPTSKKLNPTNALFNNAYNTVQQNSLTNGFRPTNHFKHSSWNRVSVLLTGKRQKRREIRDEANDQDLGDSSRTTWSAIPLQNNNQYRWSRSGNSHRPHHSDSDARLYDWLEHHQ
ncbi:MAG: hypothetical protein ACSHYA_06900 [Opitutaceae bacterium]